MGYKETEVSDLNSKGGGWLSHIKLKFWPGLNILSGLASPSTSLSFKRLGAK